MKRASPPPPIKAAVWQAALRAIDEELTKAKPVLPDGALSITGWLSVWHCGYWKGKARIETGLRLGYIEKVVLTLTRSDGQCGRPGVYYRFKTSA